MTKFSTVYMPGFMADKFDVTQDESIERFSDRAKNTLVDMLTDECKSDYDDVTKKHEEIEIKDVKCRYAMLPVWMLSTKWENQNFLFAMNGQTGAFVGDLPCDKKKRIITGILSFIVSLIGVSILGSFFDFGPFAIMIGAGIITALIISHFNNQLKSVAKAKMAKEYVKKETFECSKRRDNFLRQEVEYYDND